ncbi:hypothetical protein LTR95_016760 [Oleoguttula sp. CCFEE 5521]
MAQVSKESSNGDIPKFEGENKPAVPTETRKAFEILLESAKKLSEDKAISSILDSIDKVPALVEEVRCRDEKERLHQLARREALKDYNQDRDDQLAREKQLQERVETLQQQVTESRKTVGSLKTAEVNQSTRIKTLEDQVKQKDLDIKSGGEKVQGLIKAIGAEKQKIEALTNVNKNREARFAQLETENKELEKAWTNSKKRGEWMEQQLQDAAKLTVPLRDDLKVHSIKSLPVPQSNTIAAKQMRCIVILASLARAFAEYLFHPTHLLRRDSGIRDMLVRQAQADSAKEFAVRASLQALLPSEQEGILSERINELCDDFMALVGGLLAPSEQPNFRDLLKDLAENASEAWRELCCFTEAVEPRFDVIHYDDWSWDELVCDTNRPIIRRQGVDARPDRDEAMFAISPRLYTYYGNEGSPETHGVLFMSSQAQSAEEEVERLPSIPQQDRGNNNHNRIRRPERTTAQAS